MPKLSQKIQIASHSGSSFSVIKDITNFEKYAIEVTYGAGTGTSTKLQASINYDSDTGTGDWTDIAGSTQALDNAGGVHMWNVSDAAYPFVKVVVTGDAATVKVFFAGDPQPRRG